MNNMQKAHDVLIQHLIGWKAENVKLTTLHEADATTQRQPLATANSVILESTKLLSDNTNFLGVVRRAWKTKADEWEQRSSTRASEQAAIQEAKEIPAEFALLRQPGRSLHSTALHEIAMQVMALSAGHFDAVLNDTEKMVSILTKSSFTKIKCSRSLMPNFTGGRHSGVRHDPPS